MCAPSRNNSISTILYKLYLESCRDKAEDAARPQWNQEWSLHTPQGMDILEGDHCWHIAIRGPRMLNISLCRARWYTVDNYPTQNFSVTLVGKLGEMMRRGVYDNFDNDADNDYNDNSNHSCNSHYYISDTLQSTRNAVTFYLHKTLMKYIFLFSFHRWWNQQVT